MIGYVIRSSALLVAILTVSATACDRTGASGNRNANDGSASAAPHGVSPAASPLSDDAPPTFEIQQLWTSDEDALFTYISHLDVDQNGTVFVADASALTVSVLSSGGELLRTIGRKGSGPGEFQGIGSIQIGAGDTLFVFDPMLQRLTAFRPHDDSTVYTRHVAGRGTGAPQRAYRIRSGPQIIATYMPPFQAGASDDRTFERRLLVRLLEPDGTIERDSLLVGMGSSNLFRRVKSLISVGTNAFGRQPLVHVSSSDHLYYARTDSVGVTVMELDGSTTRRCALATDPVKVRPEDLRREQELTSPRLRDVLADSMPDVWPPLAGMVIDEKDGVWLGLTGDGGRADRWVLCDRNGVVRGTVRLPAGVTLAAVQGDLLYGTARDEDQVPFIQAYRFMASLNKGASDGRE